MERTDFIDLGIIKGKIGDQNYTLGSNLDLAKYRAVSILVQTIQRESRSRGAETDAVSAESLTHHLAGIGRHHGACPSAPSPQFATVCQHSVGFLTLPYDSIADKSYGPSVEEGISERFVPLRVGKG